MNRFDATTTETKTYFGKYPGVVYENAPEEDGVHRGRLRVDVPGILEENPDDASSERPIRVLAKPCFPPGLFRVPEPGDPVWIEFVAGSIDEPLWSGVWYPENKVPQNADDEPPTEHDHVIRTPSGHVVEMSGEEAQGRVVVRDGVNDQTVTMDADGIRLEDAHGNAIRMSSDGIRLEAGGCTIEMGGSTISLSSGIGVVEIDAAGITATDAFGNANPLALAGVLNWLMTHQHVGNMGGPTPPFPADLGTLGQLIAGEGVTKLG